MTAPGRDHFSHGAAAYAAFRPRYPAALFAWLAAHAPAWGRTGHPAHRAWDCATGSGQAAIGLAEQFGLVVASDASAAQLAQALPHPRVRYLACSAERSALAGESVALVTVAQALHWLELDAFYAEARRVLVPGGLLAAWCYGLLRMEGEIGAVVRQFATATVGPFWPPERALVDAGYAGLPFPFAEIDAPALELEQAWSLNELVGYLGTWSAVRGYRQARGDDPLVPLAGELRPLWGEAEGRRQVRWPVRVRAGYA